MPRCITAMRSQIWAATRKSWVMNSIDRPKPRLEVFEQIQHLRLHGDVERGDGFVGDQDFRIERQRAGDADALPLAAGEFVRIAFHRAGIEADQAQQFVGALLAPPSGSAPCAIGPSVMMLPTLRRGLSEANGS